jgi:hypothetical protein
LKRSQPKILLQENLEMLAAWIEERKAKAIPSVTLSLIVATDASARQSFFHPFRAGFWGIASSNGTSSLN